MARTPKAKDDPDAPMTALIGAAGVFAVFLLVLALQALFFYAQKKQAESKSYGYAFDQIRSAQAQQEAELNTYRWIDQSKGIVAVPIDRAMSLTVAALQASAATQPYAQELQP